MDAVKHDMPANMVTHALPNSDSDGYQNNVYS